MLNKRNRIGHADMIARLSKEGKIFKTPLLFFRFETGTKADSQFAVNVSKKIYHDAVPRNRLRRQIHEALRANLTLLKKPWLALISVRIPLKGTKSDFESLSQNIIEFFNHLNTHEK